MVDSPRGGTVAYRAIGRIPGYRFGDDGSAWSSLPRNGKGAGGAWRELKPGPGHDGWAQVRLRVGGETRTFVLSRLILEAFRGPCPPGMEACHFPDSDRMNCRLDNLRWDTSAANKADMLAHGTRARGESHGRAKLRAGQVACIKARLIAGEKPDILAPEFGVTPRAIRLIGQGKNWAHVPAG